MFFQPSGFTIEITNTNNSTVMVGVRVLVGSQSIERAPSYVEVFGRTVQVTCQRARWVDLPFTREESLNADKKFSLFCKLLYDILALMTGCSSGYFQRVLFYDTRHIISLYTIYSKDDYFLQSLNDPVHITQMIICHVLFK